MLRLGDFKYWTMGSPESETILVNKAKIHNTPYDCIAESYDSMCSSHHYAMENTELVKMLPDKDIPVLDIGCGTGFLLDYVAYADYVGIDISTRMLSVLLQKHPKRLTFNLSYMLLPQKYNQNRVKLALFGVGSYLSIAEIHRLSKDKHFLMFYMDRYCPVSHKAMKDIVPVINADAELRHTSNRIAWGNYIIYENIG